MTEERETRYCKAQIPGCGAQAHASRTFPWISVYRRSEEMRKAKQAAAEERLLPYPVRTA